MTVSQQIWSRFKSPTLALDAQPTGHVLRNLSWVVICPGCKIAQLAVGPGHLSCDQLSQPPHSSGSPNHHGAIRTTTGLGLGKGPHSLRRTENISTFHLGTGSGRTEFAVTPEVYSYLVSCCIDLFSLAAVHLESMGNSAPGLDLLLHSVIPLLIDVPQDECSTQLGKLQSHHSPYPRPCPCNQHHFFRCIFLLPREKILHHCNQCDPYHLEKRHQKLQDQRNSHERSIGRPPSVLIKGP